MAKPHTGGSGFSTRYDNDLGGNHIERERDRARSSGIFLGYAMRRCLGCGKKKPTKGGKGQAGKHWRCADCVAVSTTKVTRRASARSLLTAVLCTANQRRTT